MNKSSDTGILDRIEVNLGQFRSLQRMADTVRSLHGPANALALLPGMRMFLDSIAADVEKLREHVHTSEQCGKIWEDHD